MLPYPLRGQLQNITKNLVTHCEVAVHYAAQAAEYVVLNAHRLTYGEVINRFRAVAAAWGIGTKGYDEVVMSINYLKEDLVNYSLTPARVWLQIKNLFHTGKHLLPNLIAFMDMLECNTCMDYVIVLDKEENESDLLFGE